MWDAKFLFDVINDELQRRTERELVSETSSSIIFNLVASHRRIKEGVIHLERSRRDRFSFVSGRSTSIYACTRRVRSSAGSQLRIGAGPRKTPSASLANYWKEGQGRFQFAANFSRRRAEAARKGVAVFADRESRGYSDTLHGIS